jgi:hypothetical protein
MATPPAVEDQARLLEDALIVVRQQTHLMRKCLETPGKLMDALKCRYVNVPWHVVFGPVSLSYDSTSSKATACLLLLSVQPSSPNSEPAASAPSNTTSYIWRSSMHCAI